MRRQDKEQYNNDVCAHQYNVEHDKQMCDMSRGDKILIAVVGACALWHIAEAIIVFFG